MFGSTPPDPKLFELLKSLRNKLAAERGVPAYVVFSNKTLEQMATLKPDSEDEALTIDGIGPAKAEKYLPPFLAEVSRYKES